MSPVTADLSAMALRQQYCTILKIEDPVSSYFFAITDKYRRRSFFRDSNLCYVYKINYNKNYANQTIWAMVVATSAYECQFLKFPASESACSVNEKTQTIMYADCGHRRL